MKVEHLTFTRFVAALLVVFFHLGASSLAPTSVAGSLLQVGNSAVSYFFVLSGFILVVSTARGGRLPTQLQKRDFWRNRFARIYPLYLFALVLTILLGVLTSSSWTSDLNGSSVAASIGLVQAWWPRFVMQLNYPGWSLSVEALFYALFPLLYTAIIRQPTCHLLVAVSVFWGLSLAVHAIMIDSLLTSAQTTELLHDFTLYFPPLHLSTFLAGIVAGVVFIRHRAWLIRYCRWLTVSFVLLLISSFGAVLGHFSLVLYHHNGLFVPLFVLFILWLSTQNNGFTRLLSRPLAMRLGEISYGIYLLQVPVGIVTFYINYQFLHWSVWAYIPAYVGLLLLVSSVCYRYIEQPARRLIRQWQTPALASAPADEQLSRPT